MSDSSRPLDEEIVSNFLDNLESSGEVSEGVSSVIADLSDEDDFGGRDKIVELTFEAVSSDED